MTGWQNPAPDQQERDQQQSERRRQQGGQQGGQLGPDAAPPQWETPAAETPTAGEQAAHSAGQHESGSAAPQHGGSAPASTPAPAAEAGAGANPLTALVGQFAGQLQQQRWVRAASGVRDQGPELETLRQLAMGLSRRYRAMGAAATPADLAAALLSVTDAGDRAQLGRVTAGLISATRPGEREALMRAASDPGGLLAEHEQATQPVGGVQVQRAAPGAGSADAAQGTGAAREQGAAQGKGREGPPAAVPAARPAPPAAAAHKPPEREAETKKAVPAADPQRAAHGAAAKPAERPQPKKAAAAAAHAGGEQAGGKQAGEGGGAVPDLHLVSREALAASGLNVPPDGLHGSAAIFGPQGWARLQQAQQKSQQPEPGAEAAAASHAAEPHAAHVSVPSVKVSGAQLKRVAQKNRQRNRRALETAVKSAARAEKGLDTAATREAARVQAAGQAAQARVAGALGAALSQVASAAAAATSQVNAAAAQSAAQVNAAHQKTVQAIRQAAVQERSQLAAALAATQVKLTAEKAALDAGTQGAFASAAGGMISAAGGVAGQASALGESRAAGYQSAPVPSMSRWDKFKDGGDFEQKKHDARVDAARETGQSYANNFKEAGSKQADRLDGSRAAVLAGNTELLGKYTTSLTQKNTELLAQVTAASAAATTQANALKTTQLAAIASQKRSALAGIAQTRSSMQGQARQVAGQQRAALGRQASAGAAGVRRQAQQIRLALRQQAQAARKDGAKHLDEDAQAFDHSMKGLAAHLGQVGQAGSRGLAAAATGSRAAISKGAAGAVSSVTRIGSQARASCSAAAAGAARGLSGLASQAAASFSAQETGYQQQATKLVEGAKKGYSAAEKNFSQAAKTVTSNLTDKLDSAVRGFGDALTATMNSGSEQTQAENPAITDKANAAADAVQPRWKAVVKVVIQVVVAVAVTAVMLALAATGVGVIALIGLGVLIGAASSVATQALDDVVDGHFSGWKAYGAAAVGGAIGGALGGLGGGAATAFTEGVEKALLARSLNTLAVKALTLTGESVINTGVGLVGEVGSGYANQGLFGIKYNIGETFSASHIAQGLAMNAGGSLLNRLGASEPVKKFLDAKVGGLTGKFRARFPNTSKTLGRFNSGLDKTLVENQFVKGAKTRLEGWGKKVGSIGGKTMPEGRSGALPGRPGAPEGPEGGPASGPATGAGEHDAPPHLLGSGGAGRPSGGEGERVLAGEAGGSPVRREENSNASNLEGSQASDPQRNTSTSEQGGTPAHDNGPATSSEGAAPEKRSPLLPNSPALEGELRTLIKARGATDDTETLRRFLEKVPEPLELRAMLRKLGDHEDLLNLLEKRPVEDVRRALSEIDGRSFAPEFASRLLSLKLKFVIQSKKMTPEQAALINRKIEELPPHPTLEQQNRFDEAIKLRNAVLDSFYEGRVPKKLTEGSDLDLITDKEAGEEYRKLLIDILKSDDTEYAYRATTQEAIDKYIIPAGKIGRPGHMTNVMPNNANDMAKLTQIEGRWYPGDAEGLPDVVIRIPKSALDSIDVPKISGNNQDLLGYELSTSAYPTAGAGGALQFMGTTSSFDKSWIIPLKAINPGRR